MLRFLLDAKDLMEVVERDAPLSVAEFTQWLRARDGFVVLTFANVSEFADCLLDARDILYVRSILRKLEGLPVAYLNEALIEVNEIEAAVEAFEELREPNRVSPYVSRWDETTVRRGEQSPVAMIVNYRLDMMIFDLLGGPDGMELRSHRRRTANATARAMLDERKPRPKTLKPRQAFTDALERKISHWGLRKPSNMSAFGKWTYADATRCPGSRIAWELFRALVGNREDTLEGNDVWDSAHFPAIPYVDYLTFDRRMTGYYRDISNRLAKQTPEADYRGRAYRNLGELLQAALDRG